MKNKLKVSVTEVKKTLKQYNQETLISIILDCYKLSSETKNYIHVLIKPEEAIEALYNETKHLIKEEFFPERGEGKLRLAKAKKAIADFKKLSNDDILTIDLMLFYVEIGIEYAQEYYDISDSLFNSLISVYSNAADSIRKKELLFFELKNRLKAILKSSEHIYWEVFHELCQIYMDLAGDFEDGDESD